MPETKYILILANSARTKNKYCVAGKIATPLPDGRFDFKSEWIRLNNPSEGEGAVPYATTICPGRGAIQPLDIIEVQLQCPCNNPNHPEDWNYDPAVKWKWVTRADKSCLPDIVDDPVNLWIDVQKPNSVPVGYVTQMLPQPSTLCLIEAPKQMDFLFWKKTITDDQGKEKTKSVRELSFYLARQYHEFSVTDPAFMLRHKIWDRMTDMPQNIRLRDTPPIYLCLSLGLEFRSRHYKICATIFEP